MIDFKKKILLQWTLTVAAVSALTVLGPASASARDGITPVDSDGKPLNLGFEEGTLRGWTASGNAFEGQPVKGDTVAARRSDMKSGHDGEYWLGGFELHGDNRTGTLQSDPFRVTHPFGSFLVAGGEHRETRVEVVLASTGKAIIGSSAPQTETLRPVVVDLKDHVGSNIFIRVVDEKEGHWGHVNYDDFRFHASRPEFDNELDPEAVRRQFDVPPLDEVLFAGLEADEAARAATMPDGFKLHVFAHEPMVQQPIAMALDARGRLWIAEGYAYPRRRPEGEGTDRILIFEDTDGDHAFDKRSVFMDNLNLISGLEVGFGGVWVGAAPYLMFIPDADGDDKPDGDPQILLDGWDFLRDTHETLNTFKWGPDGWLYGCHGVFCPSHVGKPGTPMEDRQRVDAGVWRYHPVRHEFEVFAEGTSNPWGIDFNDYGHCIIEACVIPHLWHMIQGARYQRQGGQHYSTTIEEMRRNQPYLAQDAPAHLNPFIYEDIKTIADHFHYAGSRGPHAGNGRSDAVGGGHAHAGLMCYLGGSWPEQFHDKAFMGNIHGQRINMDILHREGSGYVGSHGEDFLNFNDRWSQVLNFLYDQNGSVYFIDWYDKNQCHHNNVDGHDRSNGRIYKMVYNNEQWTPINLYNKSDIELARLQVHRNEFHVRQARQILMHRAAAGTLDGQAVRRELNSILSRESSVPRRLRALWTLQATGLISERQLLSLLNDPSEHVRAWSVQFLAESNNPGGEALEAFARLAEEDSSQLVRLYLASAMQRTPLDKRKPVLLNLIAHAEDADDHNLPLMYWYALEPVVGSDRTFAIQAMAGAKIPKLRQFTTRRIATTPRRDVASSGTDR